jgi:hypothetical protein
MIDDAHEELLTIESTIGHIQLAALQTGGDELLDAVIGELGVAHRHVERIRRNILTLTPGVREEIAASIARARLKVQEFGPKKA